MVLMSKKTLNIQQSGHPKYRPDIDGLRAIAVLSVVVFHAFPSLIPGGFVGVDIFFIISGFLITSIIIGGLNNGKFSFIEFYSRRVNRIFPALIIVLAAVWGFGWFPLFSDDYANLGKHIAGGTAFISNFLLLSETGYFDASSDYKILLHLWSLGIEEQFYLLWPLILWITVKNKINTLLVISIILSSSFLLNINGIVDNPGLVFYSPQTRFWELLIGAILAVLMLKNNGKFVLQSKRTNEVISICGFILLVISFSFINKSSIFPGWWALLPTIGAVLIIYSGENSFFNKKVLSNKILVWFGLISFPLYLWHWPLLAFSRIMRGSEPHAGTKVFLILFAILFAWITYSLVEKPLRKTGPNNKKTTSLCVTLTVIGLVGWVTYYNGGFKNRNYANTNKLISEQLVGGEWKYSNNELCKNKYKFKDADSYGWFFCMANSSKDPNIILIGNSYANHLYPGMVHNERTNGNSILSFGACDAGITREDARKNKDSNPCFGDRAIKQKEYLQQIISKSKSLKYAIVNGLSSSPTQENIKNVDEWVNFLSDNNIKTIIFTPHIHMDYDIKTCFPTLLSSAKNDCIINIENRKKVDESFKKLTDYITSRHPDTKIFDQNELFCGSGTCSALSEGMPLFRDNAYHLSEFGSDRMAELFVLWAEKNAPDILTK